MCRNVCPGLCRGCGLWDRACGSVGVVEGGGDAGGECGGEGFSLVDVGVFFEPAGDVGVSFGVDGGELLLGQGIHVWILSDV